MRKLSESVWGDLRKKSLGQEVRIENDVENMTSREFYEYIIDNYDIINTPNNDEMWFYSPESDMIQIPLVYNANKYYKQINGARYRKVFHLQIWDMNHPGRFKFCISNGLIGEDKELAKRLKGEFWITHPNAFWCNIMPRDPEKPWVLGKLTKKFIIQVIDFILENPSPYKPIIANK